MKLKVTWAHGKTTVVYAESIKEFVESIWGVDVPPTNVKVVAANEEVALAAPAEVAEVVESKSVAKRKLFSKEK